MNYELLIIAFKTLIFSSPGKYGNQHIYQVFLWQRRCMNDI